MRRRKYQDRKIAYWWGGGALHDVPFSRYDYSDQVKKDETGRAYKYIYIYVDLGKPEGMGLLENIDLNERIIFK